MAAVHWVKSTTGNWLPLNTFNVSNVATTGVYVIWHSGSPGRVVRVGQGDIKARLCCHRDDPKVQAYKANGTLYVTWAEVPLKAQRDGIERYFANLYKPLVGDAWPDVTPIAANHPF